MQGNWYRRSLDLATGWLAWGPRHCVMVSLQGRAEALPGLACLSVFSDPSSWLRLGTTWLVRGLMSLFHSGRLLGQAHHTRPGLFSFTSISDSLHSVLPLLSL